MFERMGSKINQNKSPLFCVELMILQRCLKVIFTPLKLLFNGYQRDFFCFFLLFMVVCWSFSFSRQCACRHSLISLRLACDTQKVILSTFDVRLYGFNEVLNLLIWVMTIILMDGELMSCDINLCCEIKLPCFFVLSHLWVNYVKNLYGQVFCINRLFNWD